MSDSRRATMRWPRVWVTVGDRGGCNESPVISLASSFRVDQSAFEFPNPHSCTGDQSEKRRDLQTGNEVSPPSSHHNGGRPVDEGEGPARIK
jgi:hypothetical protein